ncbi:hypothetical protein ACRE_015480 [Hapsidospora chrysogenum ATCC 11550]|uniref:Uncharacterized protein n=1 Tax=Hapsidospora chrysogenum (strain ATCC 11550 / CBS 779.69 / DSM 880 / IAM 14645 / JCM 23072 / IMI 49137) TaxID=857340 RepID=A0A086TE46_HAPC1|nr:hypothetical protein ACRE_015480 [Hapsidospora chrysogenum ATCC 11550]
MGVVSAICVILLTLFHFFINICLTILGYFPGHIHAFYILFVYYDRREQAKEGRYATRRAPGVYSDSVQSGGYGTMSQPPPPVATAPVTAPAPATGTQPAVVA